MRMSAVTLDLSRFPPPLAIRGVSFESIVEARRARIVPLLSDAGITYNTDTVETDPVMILQESDAFREMLVKLDINENVRAIMIAFAIGADLEHMGAFYGVTRRVIVPAHEATPAVMESDEELRRRILLAPEAFAAAGPEGAYIFHALSADPRVLNVDVWNPAPGEVIVAVQARAGSGLADTDLVDAVRSHLHRIDIKPLTDVVTVQSVTNHNYAVDLTAFVRPGPDPAAVEELIVQSVTKMAAERRTPSRDVPRSAILGAAQLAAVDKVVMPTPSTDIARGRGEVAVLNSLNVTVTEYDG